MRVTTTINGKGDFMQLACLMMMVMLQNAMQVSANNCTTSYSDTTRILFVGNSLTYANDLPKLVEQFGKTKGRQISTKMIAYANYALEDHWNDGEVQQLIATEQYDYVVVQQGPSSQSEGRAMLIEYGARIKELCDVHKTKLVFYMVWPARSNIHMFDGVIKNYGEAATSTNAILCPVGQVWKKYFEETGDYSFYGPDQFHPSHAGSQNAAEIIVNCLFK